MNFVHATSSDGRAEILNLDHSLQYYSVLHEAEINSSWIDFDLRTLDREAVATECVQRTDSYRDLCLNMQISTSIDAIDLEW